MIENINRYNFDYVTINIPQFETNSLATQSQLKIIKITLKQVLEDLVTQTNNKAKAFQFGSISFDNLLAITENIQKLVKGKNTAKILEINFETDQFLEKEIESIYKIIHSSMINDLKEVEAEIDNKNYPSADTLLSNLTKLNSLLDKSPHYSTFNEEIQKLKEQANKEFDEIVQNYQDKNLEELKVENPLILFKMLESGKSIYQKKINTICKILQNKFNEKIKTIMKNKEQTISQKLKDIQDLTKFQRNNPDQIKEEITYIIEDARDNLLEQMQAEDTAITDAIDSKDIQLILIISERNQKYVGSVKIQNTIQTYLKAYIKEKQDQIESELNTFNFQAAFNNIENLIEHQPKFEKIKIFEVQLVLCQILNKIEFIMKKSMQLIRGLIKKNSTTLMENELSLAQTIEKEQENGDASIISMSTFLEGNSTLEQAFDTLNQYVQNIQIFKNVKHSLMEQLQIFFIEIFQFYNGVQKYYKEAIEKVQISKIKVVLILMKNCNFLFEKIQSNIKMYNTKCENSEISKYSLNDNYITYHSIIYEVSVKLENMSNDVKQAEILNKEVQTYQNKREEYYNKLNQQLTSLKSSPTLKGFIKQEQIHKAVNNVEVFEQKVVSLIQEQKEVINNPSLEANKLKEFSIIFNCMNIFSNIVKSKNDQFQESLKQVKNGVDQKVTKLSQDITVEPNVEKVSENLIQLKLMSENIAEYKTEIENKIDDALLTVKKTENGYRKIAKIAKQLDNFPIGKIILKDHESFTGVNISQLNQKYQTHKIEYFLDRFEGDDFERNYIQKRYEEVMKVFKAETEILKTKNSITNKDLQVVINKIKTIQDQVSQKNQKEKNIDNDIFKCQKGAWNQKMKNFIPELIGLLFALWSLQNAGYFFEASGQEDQEFYLFQPHAGQILSILRILCCGNKSNSNLQNNLVQIGTGEGKSVTLGITSCILAIFGFNVFCVCYSQYLSERDFDLFKELFTSLQLINSIRYSTINNLCEYMLNQHFNIREGVLKAIQSNDCNVDANKIITKPQIILIDEVDVFFSKDFYGNIYQPQTQLKDPLVTEFIDYVWSQKYTLTYSQMQKSPQLIKLKEKFKKWEDLIEEAARDILYDSKHFQTHDYKIKDDKIGYQDQDQILFNISYGYKTMFAYYQGFEDKQILEQTLNNQKSLKITCSAFSFAEIPSKFSYIIGVTGTLKTLSAHERQIVENEFNIKHFSYIPSAFGANNRQFDYQSDCLIENEADFYNSLARQIENRMFPSSNIKLACLVFFESREALTKFENCDAFQKPILMQCAKRITEEMDERDKKHLIKYATESGTITLMTRSFGRGIDFVCGDQMVQNNGGVQVITTFLPEQYSEEVQIQGRTARQGAFGRYCLVLLDKDLEKYLGAEYKKVLEERKTEKYSLINQKRNELFEKTYKNDKEFIKKSLEMHQNSERLVINLINNKLDSAKQFLIELNKGPQFSIPKIKPNKTIVLMDATGSMGGLIAKAKQTISDMYLRAYQILKKNSIEDDCIYMMFAVFRNYSDKQNVHSSSPWECKPSSLENFMNTISASGGNGPGEAVEIGLQWAAMQAQTEAISQVLLIGDAPSNEPEETIYHRNSSGGEAYWSGTKFNYPTSYEQEIQKLNSKSVPLYAFYIADYAKDSYQKMGSLSKGGKSQFLDVNGMQGAAMLTDIVVETILKQIGNENGYGDEFVEQYKKAFPKSYS